MDDTSPGDDGTDDPGRHRRAGDDDGGGADATRADAASPAQVDELERDLREAGDPFARVTVVRREPPVSTNVGDRAIVTADGDLVGWIGGAACAQSVTKKEAAAALESGEPRLVGLAPDPDEVARPGLEAYPMTCHSQGTLELFVDPVTPTPRLVVVGATPAAAALRRLGRESGYAVTAVVDADADAEGDGRSESVPNADTVVDATDAGTVATAMQGADAVVVTSMGEYDTLGVEAGLRAAVPYVALVASDKRRDELAAAVGDTLGVDADDVIAAVTTPAGLRIGAKSPDEMAIAVLAELVAVRRGATGPVEIAVGDTSVVDVGAGDTDLDPAADAAADHDHGDGHGDDHHHDHASATGTTDGNGAETVVDPVCGMDVAVGEAAATVVVDGITYHFCGQGCADAFEADPERYREDATGVVASE
jgi:xanthine dehydrogenase accessory factor